MISRGAERTFGPRGKKFVWALWSVVPQKHMISKKKGHSVRRFSNFGLKSSDEQKKGHSLRRCSNFGSTSSDEQHKVIFRHLFKRSFCGRINLKQVEEQKSSREYAGHASRKFFENSLTVMAILVHFEEFSGKLC